jgi:hypothetical protein
MNDFFIISFFPDKIMTDQISGYFRIKNYEAGLA